MQPKLVLQMEYYQPLYLQLRVNPKKKKQLGDGGEEEELDHLPGYLPADYVKAKHQTTVARM